MSEAINSVSTSFNGIKTVKPGFSSKAAIPESPEDIVEISTAKNTDNRQEKTFLRKYGVDIAAFATGIAGVGAAVRMGRINSVLERKAIVLLESVGEKTSPKKSWFSNKIGGLFEKMEHVLTRDKLTGLYNRRYLDEYLKKAVTRARENGTDLYVVMFDIDRFKSVNTAIGHDGGDKVLTEASKTILDIVENYRKQGKKLMFARYGGEEFTLVAEGMPKKEAKRITNQLRAAVNNSERLKPHAKNFADFYRSAEEGLKERGVHTLSTNEKALLNDYENLHRHVEQNEGFTMSAGLTSFSEHDEIIHRADEAVKLSDLALQRAKNNGRNALIEAGDEDVIDFAKYVTQDIIERRNPGISTAARAQLLITIHRELANLNTHRDKVKIDELNELVKRLVAKPN